jgi:hypothetical protein
VRARGEKDGRHEPGRAEQVEGKGKRPKVRRRVARDEQAEPRPRDEEGGGGDQPDGGCSLHADTTSGGTPARKSVHRYWASTILKSVPVLRSDSEPYRACLL